MPRSRRDLDNLGGILTTQGDYGRAEDLYGRSLQLAEELGDTHAIATVLRSLGSVAHHRRDHARARSFYENSITRFRELNDGFCLAKSLISFALTSHEAGDHEHEGALGEQGLALLRASDGKGELALRLDQLGRAALGHGDVGRATRCFHESLTLWVEAQDAPGIATSLEALATVASARGRAPAVVRLLAAVRTWRCAQGLPEPEADREACDRALASARAQLDPTAVEAAWSEGATMTLEQAIVLARAQVTDLPPE